MCVHSTTWHVVRATQALAGSITMITSDFQGPWRSQTHRRIFVLNLELRRHDLTLINYKKKKKNMLRSMIHRGSSYTKVTSGCS